MKNYLILLVVILIVIAIGAVMSLFDQSKSKVMSDQEVRDRLAELSQRSDLEIATLSGGCFWCMEAPFEQNEAVAEVISGFAGGQVSNPSYEQVVAGGTGHREAVQVFFDPKKISYKEILDIFFLQIDPTDEGGQFADRGFQYTTAIYFHSQAQEEVAKQKIAELNNSGKYKKPVVTKVEPYINFFPAEGYHQDFYKNSAERYKQYKKGSGRQDYIEQNSK